MSDETPKFDARLKEGVAYFEEMLKVMPDDRTTLEFLAVVYPQLGEAEKAERALAALAVLQAEGLLVCAGGEGFVLLAPCAGGRVDALELRDRERRFGGILAGKVRVKVGKTRLFILQLRHDEAHLQAPVAQMDIADHMIAEKPVNTLE